MARRYDRRALPKDVPAPLGHDEVPTTTADELGRAQAAALGVTTEEGRAVVVNKLREQRLALGDEAFAVELLKRFRG